MTKLLFVDDEEIILVAISIFLEKNFDSASWALQADYYSNPLEAADHLSVERYDIVVSDYRMPEMDGIHFLQMCKKLQPDTTRIILSATEDFNVLMQALNKAGISQFVTKPWDEQQFKEVLKRGIADTRERISQRQMANQRQLDLNTPKAYGMRLLEQDELSRFEWADDEDMVMHKE